MFSSLRFGGNKESLSLSFAVTPGCVFNLSIFFRDTKRWIRPRIVEQSKNNNNGAKDELNQLCF